MPILIVLIIFLILFIVLKIPVFGRNIYAIGDNEEASKLAGINVNKHLIWIYSISGFLSAVAAMIMIGRLASSPPNVAQGAELQAIAATILGRTSFTGGIGGVETTLIGAMIMAMLTNGLNVFRVSSPFGSRFLSV